MSTLSTLSVSPSVSPSVSTLSTLSMPLLTELPSRCCRSSRSRFAGRQTWLNLSPSAAHIHEAALLAQHSLATAAAALSLHRACSPVPAPYIRPGKVGRRGGPMGDPPRLTRSHTMPEPRHRAMHPPVLRQKVTWSGTVHPPVTWSGTVHPPVTWSGTVQQRAGERAAEGKQQVL